MRHRILRRLLICCLLLPASACADKGSGEENGGNGGNADDGKRPYSEMMYVKRQGDNLYISAKMDASTDILYWFKRCLFNEVYTFYRVGTLPNTDRTPTVPVFIFYNSRLRTERRIISDGGRCRCEGAAPGSRMARISSFTASVPISSVGCPMQVIAGSR